MSAPRVAPKRALEIDNAMRIGEDMASGRTEWQGRPFHVEISTNNACNLSCVMCERPDLSYISGEKLDVVGDVVFPNASVVTPSATSEPAMGDFDKILDHCEKHDLRLNLITNGNLITDRHIDRLRGRIFKVDFSIDSHIPSVYEQIRVGGRHERMLAGLRRLDTIAATEATKTARSNTQGRTGGIIAGVDSGGALDAIFFDRRHDFLPISYCLFKSCV